MNANTALLALSVVVVLAIGITVSVIVSRKDPSDDQWIVAGRSLPLYVVVFTQFATAAGGGVLVAHVGIAYESGLSVFAYEAFVVLGFLLLALLARWLRENEFSTVPDVVRRLYGEHPVAASLAAFAAIVVPFGWLGTQFVAFAQLFSSITGVSTPVLIAFMAVVSLGVVLPGGLRSVAWSDFVFGVFMLVVSLAIGAYAIHRAGGFSGIAASAPSDLWSFPAGLGEAGSSTIWLWLFAILPGTLTNQLYYQRIFATREVRLARRGLVISGFMTLISGVYALAIGLSVRAQNGSLADPEQAAGWFISTLPAWLVAIYGGFLIATIVSTTGSALQSVVTNLVHDFAVRVAPTRPTGRRVVQLSRAITVAVTVLAAALAILFPTALSWLVATYAYSASVLAAPIFLGYVLHRRRHLDPRTAIAGMVVGLLGCAGAQIAGTAIPYAVIGIVASAVAILVAHSVLPSGPPVQARASEDHSPSTEGVQQA